MNERNWWIPVLLVMLVGAAGVMWMGIKTYQGAPPVPTYVGPDGAEVASADRIRAGDDVFKKYALMQYGSMFGDGGARGPDFTGIALHVMAESMRTYYVGEEKAAAGGRALTQLELDGIDVRVRRELKANRYEASSETVALTSGQAHAYGKLVDYFRAMFQKSGAEAFEPAGYITDDGELADLATFFFWGAWVCSTLRPGVDVSYTHNWPYDPQAGNIPGGPTLFWSVIGCFALILGVGFVLYIYGRGGKAAGWQASTTEEVATTERVEASRPSPTQRATYKFFAVAVILFLFQVLMGVLTIHDFVGFTTIFGVDLQAILPLTITRSFHIQISVLWISTCWIGASIFVLPRVSKSEPKNQLLLVNTLFWMLVVVVGGTVAGGILGPKGFLGNWWRFFGNQGWEFVELGRCFQIVLFASLVLWSFIVFRGVRPALKGKGFFTIPHWLWYSTVAITVLFISSFAPRGGMNFVIADFWRWMVIHMWAECFFEVFTTVLVAYFLVAMGLVSSQTARRVVFLAVMLFWGTGFLGIAHNFYWNAKPMETLALGSVFSTMQVIPLILLTYEAWRFRRMPSEALRNGGKKPLLANFGLAEAFLFLVAVNFWNFMGAGVFGFIINLPIVNYYEHGSYLTVNHGHAALMGVYGNLSIAGVLFCARWLVRPEHWNKTLIRASFWSLNIGLALMVVLDTLPKGILQLMATLDGGYWAARSPAFIQGIEFQTLTWLRAIGGVLFVLGGIVPIVWFMTTRWRFLKEPVALPEPTTEAKTGLAGKEAGQTV